MIKPDKSWAEFAKRIIPGPHYLGDGYDFLRMMEKHGECYVEGIVAFKRRIREVARNVVDPLTEKNRVIYGSDGGYDGWYELVCLDTDDVVVAEDKFKGEHYREARPSQYDCTGQVFTSWYSLIKRTDGLYWAIHRLAVDC